MAIENLQPLTYAVITIAFAIGTASILVRLWTRMFMVKTFGRDDTMAVFLLFVNGMQQAILYVFMAYGCGKHAATLSDYQLGEITKWLFVEEIFYMFTHWSIKQAFLFFYLRLSPEPLFRKLVYSTMVVNAVFCVVNWLLAIFQCQPFDSIIRPALYPNRECINTYVYLMVPSVLNIITDLTILILPIPTVLRLKMSAKRKIAVLSVICFGGCAVLIALLRLIILNQLATDPDISYVLGRMVIVAALEIQVAIISVNLPAMKALFTRMTKGSQDESGGYDYSSGNRYKMSSMKKSMGKRTGEFSKPQTGDSSEGTRVVGGTLTGSEEELIRGRGLTDIKVTTDVNVSTMRSTAKDSPERRNYTQFP